MAACMSLACAWVWRVLKAKHQVVAVLTASGHASHVHQHLIWCGRKLCCDASLAVTQAFPAASLPSLDMHLGGAEGR
eukprot:349649-Chlamydomonas_euryale.AAC.5